MSNINFVKDGEVVDASVRILFDEASRQLSNYLYYKEHGYTELQADIPEEKFSSVSGVGKGSLTVAGQQYSDNIRYKGKMLAFEKSLLIVLEVLKRMTGGKQSKKLVQPERLSGENTFKVYATV